MTHSEQSVTPAQRRVLDVLECAGREMTAREIRDELGARTQSPITNALRTLISRGLVSERDPGGSNWYRDRFYSAVITQPVGRRS